MSHHSKLRLSFSILQSQGSKEEQKREKSQSHIPSCALISVWRPIANYLRGSIEGV